jgi:putative tryptophan/tyrosine transport system substrate-binding protein
MRRRDVITLLGGAAAAPSLLWPLAARAQQARGNRKVGVLHPGQAAAVNARIGALREGLGGPDGSDIEMVIRLADGDLSRLPALATDLGNQRVEAILAAGPPAVRAASGATASIPVIAIDLESDPVASGLVASLARPGGNVTGVDAVEAAARKLGIRVQVFEARRVADIAEAIYALDPARIQGLLVLSSPLFGGNPQVVADLALRRTVATISLFPDIAKEGGLLAYGPNIQDLYRQAGAMARKVLQGTRPADLPAERPTRFRLVANLKTARAIGVELPTSILLRADEVIE